MPAPAPKVPPGQIRARPDRTAGGTGRGSLRIGAVARNPPESCPLRWGDERVRVCCATIMSAFPNRVRLGRSQLEVGPLGVAGGYGVDAASLREAFERGVNYFYHGSLRRSGMQQAVRETSA